MTASTSKRMRVWIVSVGETLPVDEGMNRRFRMGMLAQTLAERGHAVTYWSSGFNHYQRRQRSDPGQRQRVEVPPGWDLILLPVPSYHRSMGLRRVVNHLALASGFRRLSRVAEPPDVVIACMPTVELAYEAAQYTSERGIPLIIDVRDLHPDVALDRLPRWARGPARLGLRSVYRKLEFAFRHTVSIWGITPDFVQWGLAYAKRRPGEFDRDFPLASDPQLPEPSLLAKADAHWETLGVSPSFKGLRASFVGQMSRHLPLDDVLEAAHSLRGEPVQFVLAGAGPFEVGYRNRAAGLPNVVMPGWVDRPKVWSLLKRSSLGLAPYARSPSFQMSVPNKAIEYLSTQLPIVTSLDGRLGSLLGETHAGWVYEPGKPAELVKILTRLCNDGATLKAAAARAKQTYEQRFEPTAVYGAMSDVVEGVGA